MGKIKTSKSLGSDNISSYFLKLATPYIENALVFMLNTSLETSQFPDCWKMLASHQFLRKVIGLKSLTTAQFQFSLSSQSSLKNLFLINFTSIWLRINLFILVNQAS